MTGALRLVRPSVGVSHLAGSVLLLLAQSTTPRAFHEPDPVPGAGGVTVSKPEGAPDLTKEGQEENGDHSLGDTF